VVENLTQLPARARASMARTAEDLRALGERARAVLNSEVQVRYDPSVLSMNGLGGVRASLKAPRSPSSVMHNLDELSRAASVADRNKLTKAGRALQKHASRPRSAFRTAASRADELNTHGQTVVDDILTAPGSRQRRNRLGGVDVIAPDGRGVRFNSDGGFRGFLEPLN
jgi:hypothetical protein